MTDEDEWAAFIAFISRAPAAQHPGVLFDGFRRDLVERGATAEEAQRQMRDVMEATRQRTDWAAPMFDRIYTSSEPLFSRRPNAFTARIAAGRRPGRALDVAMGQGRNAVHLATLGWDVTGFDVSPAGLDAATRAADAAGTSIHAVLASGRDFAYGDAAWDLIVIYYALVPVSVPELAARIAAALAPGGVVVIESFATEATRPRRPVDLDPDDLRTAYRELDEVAYELEHATADWTLDPALIVRLAAERPTDRP